MEGLIEFCSKRGFGLLLTDGTHTFRDLKKIKLNRKYEKEILKAIDGHVMRKREFEQIRQNCDATHNELLRIVLKHDLFYTEFPFKLKHGGYNKVFREVIINKKL